MELKKYLFNFNGPFPETAGCIQVNTKIVKHSCNTIIYDISEAENRIDETRTFLPDTIYFCLDNIEI